MVHPQTDRSTDGDRKTDQNGASSDSPRDAAADLGERFSELKEYASYYISAKTDGVRLSIKKVGMYAVLGMVGLIAAMAVIATSAVLLIVGLGGAIGALFGIRWLGDIIIGLIVLVGLGLGVKAIMGAMIGKWHRQTVEKYESRQRQQAVEFGRNVHERATAPADTSAGRAAAPRQ
jgi:hypothetical protein